MKDSKEAVGCSNHVSHLPSRWTYGRHVPLSVDREACGDPVAPNWATLIEIPRSRATSSERFLSTPFLPQSTLISPCEQSVHSLPSLLGDHPSLPLPQ